MSRVEWVSSLERTENWRLLNFPLFLREGNVGAIGREAGIEAASLAYSIGPGLVTVNNFAIQSGILVTTIILFVLVRILRVAHLVQVCEWFGLDTGCEAGCALRNRSLGRSLGNILELRLADLLVGACGKRFSGLLILRGGARFTHDILTRVDIGVAESVALESSERLLRTSASIYCHAFVKTNFVSLLAEGLVVGARIANRQAYRHGEERISLPIQNKL